MNKRRFADHPLDPRQRVVIVGSGFGGLYAARALRRTPVQVTVIDRTSHHLFQPLLYQVATGILSAGDVAPPTRDIVSGQENAEVLLGEVRHIDLAAREVIGDSMGAPFRRLYDSLIVAAGASTSYFGRVELARFAPGLKTIDDALELRGRIFGAFEMAELERDPDRRPAWLTFAIVGAGPTGVELAGEIAELSRRALKHKFRQIDPASARVVLLDAADTLLSAFPSRLQRRAQSSLESLGVEIRLGAKVTGVDESGIELTAIEGATRALRIPARTKMWAAGVQASPLGRSLAAQSGITIDRAGRVPVQADLTLPGHPEVFGVGDMMALDRLPGVAEVALQAGRHAAKTIIRRHRGAIEPRAFRYRDFGTTATISRFRAVVVAGPVQLSGLAGWLIWLFVHLIALVGFRNRFSTLVNWSVAFLGRGRPERTITQQQTDARVLALNSARPLPDAPPATDGRGTVRGLSGSEMTEAINPLAKKVAMSDEITITDANFESEVLNSDRPVLVDYWAPWCGPCRQLAPVIDQIAADLGGQLKVAKVNVDEQPHLARAAGVQGIPFVVLYRDGQPVAHAVGAQPKAALERVLGLSAPEPQAAP